jgi:hypothetical protein
MTITATTPASPWGTEGVRLTMFPLVQVQGADTVLRLWRGITRGGEPDETSSKASVATHVVHGQFNGGRLVVVAQIGRIDIQYTAEPSPPGVAPATLGSRESVIGDFLERAQPLLGDVPPLQRLAFGAVFLQTAESREAGYRALIGFLPTLKLDAENSTEFLYQINRPRPARDHAEMAINRLMKWSVQGLTVVQLGQPLHLPGRAPTIHSPRLEVDISTPADYAELPSSWVSGLLAEMVELAQEMATKGDVP